MSYDNDNDFDSEERLRHNQELEMLNRDMQPGSLTQPPEQQLYVDNDDTGFERDEGREFPWFWFIMITLIVFTVFGTIWFFWNFIFDKGIDTASEIGKRASSPITVPVSTGAGTEPQAEAQNKGEASGTLAVSEEERKILAGRIGFYSRNSRRGRIQEEQKEKQTTDEAEAAEKQEEEDGLDPEELPDDVNPESGSTEDAELVANILSGEEEITPEFLELVFKEKKGMAAEKKARCPIDNSCPPKDPSDEKDPYHYFDVKAKTAVRAIFSGVIYYSGSKVEGYENIIFVLYPNGNYTLYSGVIRATMKDNPQQGDRIAAVDKEERLAILHCNKKSCVSPQLFN